MSYAFYYDAPGTPEMYRQVSDRIGPERPEGLVLQLVTRTSGGLRHLNVWDSREQWEAFRDGRVRTAVAAVLEERGIPPVTQAPEEHLLDVVDVSTPQLVAS
jgi:hypothetical protein